MAVEKIITRYTDEIYANRMEVAKSLGTNNIDPFWAQIIAYRKSFAFDLRLIDVTNTPLFFCLGSFTKEKLNSLHQAKTAYCDVLNSLSKESMDYRSLTNKLYATCLESIAKCNKMALDSVSVMNIISNRNVDYNFNAIQRYFSALRSIKENGYKNVTEEVLANIYAVVSGVPEITEFYRQTELVAPKQNIIINREYNSAPVSKIEEQMDQLLSLLKRKDLPTFAKAAINLYLFNYVKPFAKYNTEISILTTKIILTEELGEAAYYLPVESILAKESLSVANIVRETQRTRDLTYIVNEYLTSLNSILNDSGNIYVKSTLNSLQSEQEEITNELREEVYHEEVKPIKPVQPVIKPEVIHQREEIHVKLEPTVETKPAEPALSERELQRLTQELLETDPALKKGQAHFYIRHREPGHFYTIEQYRKCEGCVYETARTSMDTLAMKGYYRREKVNNKKFVYTPIFK